MYYGRTDEKLACELQRTHTGMPRFVHEGLVQFETYRFPSTSFNFATHFQIMLIG